jgi:hypothetical protein
MNRYRVGFWTGPSQADPIAEMLKAKGFLGVEAGTERVYFHAEGSDEKSAAWNGQVELERNGFPWPRVHAYRAMDPTDPA